MKSRKLTLITTTIVFAAFAIPLQLTAQHTHYIVTDLGTFGGTFGVALGMNNRGLVVGFSNLPDNTSHAFLWKKGVLIDLGTLGGPNSNAPWPPNERGEVGGFAETSVLDPLGEDFCSFGTHLICLPFVWQKGVMSPLPTLGGNNGQARQINNRGQVVGNAETITPDPTCVSPQVLQFNPVVWENGDIRELPTLSGDPDGSAYSINDKGQAVGETGNCAGFGPTGAFSANLLHGVLWDHGTVKDLGKLQGSHLIPLIINNQTQIVGYVVTASTQRAFLWQDGVATDIGTVPGDVLARALGINNRSQVVGISCDIDGNCRGFLWENGLMTDLNTLIPADSDLFLIAGIGVNDRGQICGLAFQISTGELHPFLATPSNAQTATAAARGQTRRGPKVVFPANVRKMLRERSTKSYLGGVGDRSLK
jgi:probable HAF family extracellular repeat protein